MQLPIQAQPVNRNISTASIAYGIEPQGCSFIQWLKCGTKVLSCVSCGTNLSCWKNCLGGLYGTCVPCICKVAKIPVIC
jgi:hypothetical protein